VAVLLLVVLSLPTISPAQNTTPVQTPQAQVSDTQQTATPVTEQVKAPAPTQHAEAAPEDGPPALVRSTASDVSQAQTATRIEDKASAAAPAQPADTPPAIAPAAASQKPHATLNPAGPVQPKYDVSQIGHRDVGSGLDFYSLDREIALGRELSKQVEQSARLVKDPIVTEYVNRIGQNLVRNSDARVPFTIKVLDTDEVNAFALPGGFFYVNSGLILAADSEAELAGVMAHEIGHVAARHATKNMTKAQIWNMASIPLIFVGGPIAFAISEVASIAVPMTFLKFSRDAEREADLLGLEYDYAAGYDPQAFVQFFEKLNVEKKKQSRLAKAFATHPMTADRIQAAQEEIRKYLPDRPEYVVNTSEFDNVKARLISLENGHRLNGPGGGDGNRPVLLKRSSTSSSSTNDSAGSSSSSGNSTTDQKKDDDRPTLKRNPNPPDS